MITFAKKLNASFGDHKDRTALCFFRGDKQETVLVYQQMAADLNRAARAFMAFGVEKGDRVILCMEKSLIFVMLHLALQKIGAISVPLNPGFTTGELAYFIHDAEPSLIMAGSRQAPKLNENFDSKKIVEIDTDIPYEEIDFFNAYSRAEIHVEVFPSDPALIIYTSGTTGKPKGAVLTQTNLIKDAENILSIWAITNDDVLCHALPLFHVHGLCFALHTLLLAGGTVLLMDTFETSRLLNVLSGKIPGICPTVFMAVPAMYAKMLELAEKKTLEYSAIRLWTSGSAPLLTKDFDRIRKVFGKVPVEREGMSETGMNFSNPLDGPKKPGAIGLPLPDLHVRIIDPNTCTDVPPGAVGEFWLKGPAITPGYWRKPAETGETFYNGWFRTGDLGRVDDEGYYYLTDRIKNIIISGGENISPKEVEFVINSLDDVVESAVVGIPDEKWGEVVVAAVAVKKGVNLSADDVLAACRKHLHKWKCPKTVVLTASLPKNTMGKILVDKVRQLFLGYADGNESRDHLR